MDSVVGVKISCFCGIFVTLLTISISYALLLFHAGVLQCGVISLFLADL